MGSLYADGGIENQPLWFLETINLRKKAEAEYHQYQTKKAERQVK